MKSALAIAIAILVPVTSALAQSARELKRELRTRESTAKKAKDPEAFYQVAQWASDKGLAADAKRLFNRVLRMDPDHEAANKGLGNARFDGKWMPKKKADELRKKAMDAEYKAKGFEQVDDIWVEPKYVEDAKRGVFHHDGDLVTKAEKMALLEGHVRHPDTGLLIGKENLAAAENHYYPVGREGRWADEKAADSYHSDLSHPWVVRTTHGSIMTTLPMARVQELKAHIDRGCERVSPLLGSSAPLPPHRPVVIVAATVDEYNQLGQNFGDETSAAPAYLMADEARIELPYHAPSRCGIAIADPKPLAPYYTRHAAAMAYLQGKCADAGASVPLWFEHGIGALASRFENDSDGAHFCRTGVVPKGGVKNLKGFFNGFAINADMEPSDISFNVTVAGLMIHFATQGGHKDVTDAMMRITAAFDEDDSKAIEKAVSDLTSELIDAEDEVIAHHQKLLAANR